MNYVDAECELRQHLGQGESLTWTGRPRQGLTFRRSDLFLIPFSLLWCSFAIFWESAAIGTSAPLFFKLWGIPFVLIGLYLVAGRFFFDAKKRARTAYGITQDRIIILSGFFQKSLKSVNIKSVSEISYKEDKDRSGTILFGPTDPRYALAQGYDWFGNRYPARLEMIEDVKNVYSRIIELQRQK